MQIQHSVSFCTVLIIAVEACMLCFTPLYALTFPQDFGYSQMTEWLIDGGQFWEANRMFHPLDLGNKRVQETVYGRSAFDWVSNRLTIYQNRILHLGNDAENGFWLSTRLGFCASGQAGTQRRYSSVGVEPFLWCQAGLQQNWYATLLVRATNEPEDLPHYSGISRERSRFGMTSGEIDQSHFGFQNDWFSADFGRGREIWGPNSEDNLTLAGTAPSYERLMLEGKYKQFAYRYFFGFLETASDSANIERYIVGRALEYCNSRNLVLGISEVSILSGIDRSVDWTFLNPFATHVEIEANKRSNNTGNKSDVDYTFYLDWLLLSNLRLAASLDIDDFQVDATNRHEAGNLMGYLAHVAWTPVNRSIGLTVFTDYVQISTYSMQHSNPYCNLVSRGQLLGHYIGNDANLMQVGARAILSSQHIGELRFGQRQWGDNSLLLAPYSAYNKPLRTSFPSGRIRTNRYIEINIDGYYFESLHYTIDGHLDVVARGPKSQMELWMLTLEWYIPLEYFNK